jgi:hypothetical protein
MSGSVDAGGPPTQPVRTVDAGELNTSEATTGRPNTGQTGATANGQSRAPGRESTPPEEKRRKGGFRYRILPRTVLGVSSLILAFAIGAGFSGVILFSYYQYKANQTDGRVNALVSGYKKQFADAEARLHADVAAAQSSIQQQLNAAQQLQAGPQELANLTTQVAPSVFFVHTLDSSGQPSVGTAFVVSSNSSESLLVTAYTTVAAATHSPGPPVYVRQGTTESQVSVRSWDPQYDLALLILPAGNLRAVTAAPTTPALQPGDRLFAVSGLGSAGASLSSGTVIDVVSQGVATDAAIGTAFQGGPVINSSAQVVAVASRVYSPLGFTSSGIWYLPFVEAACNRILACPGGTLVGVH